MLALDTMFSMDGHVVGQLVVYTENVEDDTDFSQSEDKITRKHSLPCRPKPGQVRRGRTASPQHQLRSWFRRAFDCRSSSSSAAPPPCMSLGTANGGGQGRDVSVAAAAEPSLYAEHTAAFSVRRRGQRSTSRTLGHRHRLLQRLGRLPSRRNFGRASEPWFADFAADFGRLGLADYGLWRVLYISSN
jgi:hypothetical protein